MEFLDIPLFDDDFFKMMFRFVLNFIFLTVIIRFIYYPDSKRKDYVFTYYLISIIVFFLCFTLKKYEMEVKAFAKALNELPYPALAYCASGTRSAALWASVKAETLGKDQVIAISKDAGFDIARIVPTFATDPSI